MIYFAVSGLLGILFWNFFAGKYEGHKIEQSFRPLIKGYRIHIHHWMWCAVLFLLVYAAGGQHSIILGFLAGSVVQGLRYRDRFIVIYPDYQFEQIYARFKEEGPIVATLTSREF